MSYRRAWILVDEMNRALAGTVVASATGGERGGGSALTPLGHELVEVYRRTRRPPRALPEQDIARLLELAAPVHPKRAASRRRSRPAR